MKIKYFYCRQKKENGEKSYRTATTSYPCLLSHLGDLKGAGRMTPAGAKVISFYQLQRSFCYHSLTFLRKIAILRLQIR